MTWQDEDPGLPIKLDPCSNGEFDPPPATPVVREAQRRAREACDANARRLGWTRREFLLSMCGAATTLAVLDACTKEAAKQAGRRPGGAYDVPTTATTEPGAAAEALGGDEFVFDVQSHLLEYDLNRDAQPGAFGSNFPQAACGEADARVCFDMAHFLELMFLRSDTRMVVISTLPVPPEGSPLSPEVLDETRRVAAALCQSDGRVLLHAQALPNVGALPAALEAMAAAAQRPGVKAWKVYTHFRAPGDPPSRAWRLDDGDPKAAQVGNAFLDKAEELDVRLVAVHKGFSGNDPFASPADIGPAAKARPNVRFLVYHSGYEAGGPEGPYAESSAGRGVNRLIKSLEQAGIGPNENVYAELGSTWRAVMGDPTQAAHLIGKLCRHVGEDNVLWGTDSIFYGSPQDQIQAFRALQISPELQERHGYPALTDALKAKILGGNAARLYGVDPVRVPCEFTRAELEEVRRQLPGGHQTLGPRTAGEVAAFNTHHRGWP